MTLPLDYEPKGDVMLARALRSMRQILTRGLRWSDQIAPLVTMRYDGDLVPYDVSVSGSTRPLAVLCLAATQREDRSQTESGARVTWSWRNGQVRVHAIDLTITTAEYDVTLGILPG